MALISAPNAAFTGTVVGVDFVDGVGETTNENALNYFARQGYTIDAEIDVDPEEITVSEVKPTITATKAELIAYADANSIDITDLTTKAEILAAIDEATDNA